MTDRFMDRMVHADYTETLAFTTSTDGLPLEGAIIVPAAATPVDLAIVWIHGGASRFYERHYVALGRHLAARGYPFVTGNTRGHDAFTLLWRGDEVIPAGGSFERFDESPRDIAAWVEVAMDLNVRGVVLAGHSLGASKIVYYQAHRQDARIVGLIAASPMVGWQSNPERAALAEQLVRAGRGEELLPHAPGSPAWNIVSAQMVASREHVIRHTFDSNTRAPDLAQVRCPLLVTYGSEERVDTDWLKTLRVNASSTARLDIELITGAGHEYAGQEGTLADLIGGWIETWS